MAKESLLIGFGEELKQQRKRLQWTQQEVASRTSLSMPTIRHLERGLGRLSSFWAVLGVLQLEVTGRSLPGGERLGERIYALRKRRRLSQRRLAAMVGISPPTITLLERKDRGRLETLESVLRVLGAGAYLKPPGETPSFYTHAGNSSVAHLWTTPKWLLGKLYQVFGTFDLDPCSPTASRRLAPVRARVYFTADDDGLSLPWHGTVFMNPPYGRELSRWVSKAAMEVHQRRAKSVVALIPARTDTRWWHHHIARLAHVLILRGRLQFGDGGQSAPFPSALAVWGADAQAIAQLREAFPDAWFVPP